MLLDVRENEMPITFSVCQQPQQVTNISEYAMKGAVLDTGMANTNMASDSCAIHELFMLKHWSESLFKCRYGSTQKL